MRLYIKLIEQTQDPTTPEAHKERDNMAKKQPAGHGAFVIQILDQQNATWQGTVTWTDGQKTQHFRSLLELIKLIDTALEPDPS